MYQIEFSKRARKDFLKLPKQYQKRLREKVDSLAVDPLIGKPLKGEYEGLFSLRMWPYRIVYMVIKKKLLVEIIEIPHRQSAYKN